jgi:hypothetical protein
VPGPGFTKRMIRPGNRFTRPRFLDKVEIQYLLRWAQWR